MLLIVKNFFTKEINNNNFYLKYFMDNDYCLISLREKKIVISYIILSNHNIINVCEINFISKSCDSLFDLIIKHKLLAKSISLSHALYIGKEIYKVELSKIFSQLYIQS